jgi:hypothetical protein
MLKSTVDQLKESLKSHKVNSKDNPITSEMINNHRFPLGESISCSQRKPAKSKEINKEAMA